MPGAPVGPGGGTAKSLELPGLQNVVRPPQTSRTAAIREDYKHHALSQLQVGDRRGLRGMVGDGEGWWCDYEINPIHAISHTLLE